MYSQTPVQSGLFQGAAVQEILSLKFGFPRQVNVSSRAAGERSPCSNFPLQLWSSCWWSNPSGQTVSICDKIDKINDFSRQRKCKILHLSGLKTLFNIVPHGKLSVELKVLRIYTGTVKWVQRWLKGRQWQGTLKGESSLWSEVASKRPRGSGVGQDIFHLCIDLGREHMSVSVTLTAHAMVGASSTQTRMGLLTEDLTLKTEVIGKGIKYNNI